MKYIFWFFALSASMAFGQGASDNEILITQTGDNLTLTIDQDGYGNKISGDSSQGSDLTLSGTTMQLNVDQIGNSNKLFGHHISNQSCVYIYPLIKTSSKIAVSKETNNF